MTPFPYPSVTWIVHHREPSCRSDQKPAHVDTATGGPVIHARSYPETLGSDRQRLNTTALSNGRRFPETLGSFCRKTILTFAANVRTPMFVDNRRFLWLDFSAFHILLPNWMIDGFTEIISFRELSERPSVLQSETRNGSKFITFRYINYVKD